MWWTVQNRFIFLGHFVVSSFWNQRESGLNSYRRVSPAKPPYPTLWVIPSCLLLRFDSTDDLWHCILAFFVNSAAKFAELLRKPANNKKLSLSVYLWIFATKCHISNFCDKNNFFEIHEKNTVPACFIDILLWVWHCCVRLSENWKNGAMDL